MIAADEIADKMSCAAPDSITSDCSVADQSFLRAYWKRLFDLFMNNLALPG